MVDILGNFLDFLGGKLAGDIATGLFCTAIVIGAILLIKCSMEEKKARHINSGGDTN